MSVFFILLVTSACGGGGGATEPEPSVEPTPTPEPTHQVPGWLSDSSWQLINIPDMGVYLGDQETDFRATATELTYTYPDCSVTGTLKMDPTLPSIAANEYTLTMNATDCSVQWDIPTYPGMVDFGRFFAEDATNQWVYRISDLYAAYWIYKKK